MRRKEGRELGRESGKTDRWNVIGMWQEERMREEREKQENLKAARKPAGREENGGGKWGALTDRERKMENNHRS